MKVLEWWAQQLQQQSHPVEFRVSGIREDMSIHLDYSEIDSTKEVSEESTGPTTPVETTTSEMTSSSSEEANMDIQFMYKIYEILFIK